MPEFVNRIYNPRLAQDEGGNKARDTFQGASGVSGLTSLPAMCGKLDNVLLSATLNLSISKISGTTWEVGTYSITRSQRSSRVSRLGVAGLLSTTRGGRLMIFHGTPCGSERLVPWV